MIATLAHAILIFMFKRGEYVGIISIIVAVIGLVGMALNIAALALPSWKYLLDYLGSTYSFGIYQACFQNQCVNAWESPVINSDGPGVTFQDDTPAEMIVVRVLYIVAIVVHALSLLLIMLGPLGVGIGTAVAAILYTVAFNEAASFFQQTGVAANWGTAAACGIAGLSIVWLVALLHIIDYVLFAAFGVSNLGVKSIKKQGQDILKPHSTDTEDAMNSTFIELVE